jgi:hypothetical protein
LDSKPNSFRLAAELVVAWSWPGGFSFVVVILTYWFPCCRKSSCLAAVKWITGVASRSNCHSDELLVAGIATRTVTSGRNCHSNELLVAGIATRTSC